MASVDDLMGLTLSIIGHKDNKWQSRVTVGQVVCLVKEPSNKFDSEAIMIKDLDGNHIGYVANSTGTVSLGTNSAGRMYDKFGECTKARVKFVVREQVAIAELISCDADTCN